MQFKMSAGSLDVLLEDNFGQSFQKKDWWWSFSCMNKRANSFIHSNKNATFPSYLHPSSCTLCLAWIKSAFFSSTIIFPQQHSQLESEEQRQRGAGPPSNASYWSASAWTAQNRKQKCSDAVTDVRLRCAHLDCIKVNELKCLMKVNSNVHVQNVFLYRNKDRNVNQEDKRIPTSSYKNGISISVRLDVNATCGQWFSW